MGEPTDVARLLEKQLSYWKNYFSVQDVLASELSYSIIFDNIRADKLSDALATVGLTTLPSRLYLVQVDDYYNYSSKLRITQEFFQKKLLIKMLRERMKKLGIAGFVANLVGEDRITCFLCCDERGEGGTDEYLLSVAEQFKACIREGSPYTVSICISGRCNRLAQFSRMYPRMNLALSKSYFSGKEFSILLEHVTEYAPAERVDADLSAFYPDLLVSIARRNREQFERVLQKMLQTLLESQIQPQGAKLEMIRLVQRMDEYCIQCGLPERQVLSCGETAINKILACSFIADTGICFRAYCEQAAQALETSDASEDHSFKLPVMEYIAGHYREALHTGQLASVMGFSEGHFARMFRETFGTTFVQYLTEYRIARGKELLAETRIPIEQIAHQVGINNYSYFCTRFKAVCGMSPGAYRKRSQCWNL